MQPKSDLLISSQNAPYLLTHLLVHTSRTGGIQYGKVFSNQGTHEVIGVKIGEMGEQHTLKNRVKNQKTSDTGETFH